MYDKSDPRSNLASAPAEKKKAATSFFTQQAGKFYATEPQETGGGARTWITRGQAMIVAYSEAEEGAVLSRRGQADEYAVIIPDKDTRLEFTTSGGTEKVEGYRIAFVPPGDSSIRLLTKGRIVRLFSPKTADLAAKASNAAAYATPDPNVAPFQPWPDPVGGFKLRHYSLDVPQEKGRFGRIFRCTTFMVNYLEPRVGKRDPRMLSPHHHDDFEQCSLALEGSFVHHLRWPWTTDMTTWREDEHEAYDSPSICVIPPPVIHTTTSEAPGVNQLVDIFAPPRFDFSAQPGWVLNEKDYPAPPK
jgi:hypothetical protein